MFDTEITYQTDYNQKPQTITLSQWLKWCKNGHPDKKVMQQLQQYRELLSIEIQKGLTEAEAKKILEKRGHDKLKKGLPLVAPGAVCTTRRKKGYIDERTGWIALDIDLKDNPHLVDTEQLRNKLMNNVYIAYAGISTGGGGLWCLIKVSHPERHSEHFQQLIKDFASRGIVLDSSKGQNPHDARFYSYDPGAKVKKAKIYDRLPIPQKKQRKRTHRKKIARSGNVFIDAMNFAIERGYTFTPGCKKGGLHYSILVMCRYLNWKGVPEYEAESWIKANITSEINSNCISWAYADGKDDFGAGNRGKYTKVKSTPGGYPSSWDEIEAPEPGSQQDIESVRAVINDAEPAELEILIQTDPVLRDIVKNFECAPY